jgi:hypothetical protein
VKSEGGLSKNTRGIGWGMVKYHGVVAWPEMVVGWIGAKADTWKEITIEQKRALSFEYEDQQLRFMGCAVDRGDALIYIAIGCPKESFDQFKETFKKVISIVRCAR